MGLYGVSVEGTPFGRYRLLEIRARGGMGEVWRAYDTETDRVVAVKVLPAHLAEDQSFQQRFRREARVAASLNDPHVLPIHNFGEIDGRLYVDMRLMEARDLQTLLADGPLSPERAVSIVEQVASALHAAHSAGLIHRDVKPSNILVGHGDFSYLIDFGIARGTDDTAMTQTGGMVGSWPYMAPERFSKGQLDPRSDVYALACVLHQCLTAQRPYPGETLEQLATAHMWTPPPKPSAVLPGLSPSFDSVITRGMAKNPDERYDTPLELAGAARVALAHSASVTPAQQFAYAPTQYAQQPPMFAPPPRRPWWRRKAVVISLVVLIVAVVTAAVAVLFLVGEGNSRQRVLPLDGLKYPNEVEVDAAGNVYVSDAENDRILKWAAVSDSVTTLPSTPRTDNMTVDTAGNVYVADFDQITKIIAGADSTTDLPVTGLADVEGNYYNMSGIAIDDDETEVMSFDSEDYFVDLAVDKAQNFYSRSIDSGAVKVSAGADEWTPLPASGGDGIGGIAMDQDQNAYITDWRSDRVLKLTAP